MEALERTAMSDAYAFENPALVAVGLHSVCLGFEEKLPTGSMRGLLFPWASLSIGLLLTDSIRQHLPRNASASISSFLDKQEARELKLEAGQIIRAWAPPTWAGLRLGIARGHLRLSEKGLESRNSMLPLPQDLGLAGEVIKLGKTWGRVLAKEPRDASIAMGFGLEF